MAPCPGADRGSISRGVARLNAGNSERFKVWKVSMVGVVQWLRSPTVTRRMLGSIPAAHPNVKRERSRRFKQWRGVLQSRARRGGSSVGQSAGLSRQRSRVRAPSIPPIKKTGLRPPGGHQAGPTLKAWAVWAAGSFARVKREVEWGMHDIPLPTVILFRFWLNRWRSGFRSAQSRDVVVALGYAPESAIHLDLRPRKPERRAICDAVGAQVHAQVMGCDFTARNPSKKVEAEACEQVGLRGGKALFELAYRRESELGPQEIEALALALRDRCVQALEPWAGRPIFARAQWGTEAFVSAPCGGDPGAMLAYRSPLSSLGSVAPELVALFEKQAMEQEAAPARASKPRGL